MGTKSKQKKNSKQKDVEQETKSIEILNGDNPDDCGTADVLMPEHSNNNEHQKGPHRKRKKHYFNAIRAQMEFYFGDANLSKDRFLKQLIDKDPCEFLHCKLIAISLFQCVEMQLIDTIIMYVCAFLKYWNFCIYLP